MLVQQGQPTTFSNSRNTDLLTWYRLVHLWGTSYDIILCMYVSSSFLLPQLYFFTTVYCTLITFSTVPTTLLFLPTDTLSFRLLYFFLFFLIWNTSLFNIFLFNKGTFSQLFHYHTFPHFTFPLTFPLLDIILFPLSFYPGLLNIFYNFTFSLFYSFCL